MSDEFEKKEGRPLSSYISIRDSLTPQEHSATILHIEKRGRLAKPVIPSQRSQSRFLTAKCSTTTSDVVVAKTKGMGGTYVDIRNRKAPTTLWERSISRLAIFVKRLQKLGEMKKARHH